MSRLALWLAALVRGRRSSFSVFANALTPDTKLATIQAQALKAVQAAKNSAVERAAAACLRRVDAAGLHTCSAKASDGKIVLLYLPHIRSTFTPRQRTPCSASSAPSPASTTAAPACTALLTTRSTATFANGSRCSVFYASCPLQHVPCRCHCPAPPLENLSFIAVSQQEHTSSLCQERPVRCAFACCEDTFPLSLRVQLGRAFICCLLL
jgi:hypothetical protein